MGTQLAKMAAPKQCDGTECPGGCCPYVGWYCCPDGMYCAATAADCPFVAKKTQLAKVAAAPMLAGTAALMACTVLPLLLTAHLLQRRPSLPRWLPQSSVMEQSALEAAAPMLAGTAALMACTVLPLLLTAHMLNIISISSQPKLSNINFSL